MSKNSSFFIVLIGVILVTLQTSFFTTLLGVAYAPNLLAALCFGLVLRSQFNNAMSAAVFAGLILDFITGTIPGLSSLMLTVFVLAFKLLGNFYLNSTLTKYVFAFVYFYVLRLAYVKMVVFDLSIMVNCLITLALSYLLVIFLKNEQKINL